MNSKLFRLDIKDLFKGVVVAVITALLTYVSNIGVAIDAATLVQISVTAGAAYLVKNLFSDGYGKVCGIV
jgi:hypothetical protein